MENYKRNYIFRYVNQTEKNLTIESYSRHLPRNYTSVDDESKYIEHTVFWRGPGQAIKRIGPKQIDLELYLYKRFEIKPKDSFSFVFLNDTYNDLKDHLFSDFDDRYAFPQLDKVDLKFEDNKQLTYEIEEHFLSQLTSKLPHLFALANYKQYTLIDSTISDTIYASRIYKYTITEDHYKEAR